MKVRQFFPCLGTWALLFFQGLEGSVARAAAPVQDFEAETVPAAWHAGAGGELAVTAEHFKSGKQSLRWNWRNPAATLAFHDATAFEKRAKDSAFGLWVYNGMPAATPLRAELLHGAEVVASFWFWMDYQGWRPLGASYDEVGCKPTQVVDGIRLHALTGVSSGEIYLDGARFNFKLTNPNLTRTYQMPWSGHPDGLMHPETVVLSDADICNNRPWLPTRKPTEAITPQERADMAKLAERLLPPLARPAKGLKPGILDGLRKRAAEYQIKRNDGMITGRPIDSGSLVPSDDALDVWEYIKFCAEVQRAYAQANKPEETVELKQLFVNLSAHFLDQGWAMGTQLGGWGNYPGAGLDCFFLMRDVLAEAGLARAMSLALTEHGACQGAGQYLAEKPGSSMDGLGFWNNQLLPCLLMLPDETERLQHIRAVQRYYNLALTNPDTIGPDGCSYHHGGFHFAYASYNLPRLMSVLTKTADTEFRLNQRAHERLKTYVRAIAFTLSGGEQAYNLGMRAGTPLKGDMGWLAADLAQLGTPDGTQKLDVEMAELALRSIMELGAAAKIRLEKEPAKSWVAQGLKPAPLTGHLTMNGAPLAVHRRADWLVSIAGISKFWRGLEIYGWTQSNNYGRYARNGSICVTANGKPPSLAASGWSYDGWNWCHFPGTTALERPAQDLFDGYAMYGNASAFAGGTQLGDDGLWAMDFCGGSGVQFKKSVFCFDNRVTVITSGIQLDKKLHAPAVTTLYQNSIQPGLEMVSMDGDTITGFPSERLVSGERAHWLIDNKGTGYFIPAGHDPLQLVCRKQEWTYLVARYLVDPKDNPLPTNSDYQYFRAKPRNIPELLTHYRPSAGDFALAYFNHGLNPADTTCTYTMVIQATPTQMTAFAEDPPYQILQHDSHVHAVLDRASRTTGYALFEANAAIAAAGLLRANNQPCFVMLQGDGAHLRISVACTDIKRTEPVRLKLQGCWKPRALPPEPLAVTALGGDTQLELQPDYYMPMRFELEAGK